MYHFCSFFFRVFFKFKFTSHKKKHKNRLRERVLSREGSLNFSRKEREKREREHSRATFIEQNRKRGLIEIDRERGLIEIDREREREREETFFSSLLFSLSRCLRAILNSKNTRAETT